MSGIVASALLIVLVLAFVGLTLRLLWRDDVAPATRLAWMVTFVLLPYVGIALYVLIGERRLRRGFVTRYREIGARNPVPEPIGTVEPPCGAFAYATTINGFRTTGGNRGELMPDERAATARLVADIDAARESVHILFYIWLADGTGTEVARAIVRAARRGVRCRILVDAIGSRALTRSPLWQDMKNAGAECRTALPVGNPLALLFERVDLRNHRKIAVVDGRIGFCGSQNCADPEFLPKARYGPWVDVQLRLEGPVVAQMELLFGQDFDAYGGRSPAFVLTPPPIEGGFVAQMVGTGPVSPAGQSAQLFSTLIFEARRELFVTTPYFVPDETVRSALCAAALAGVAVTLILPRRNDARTVALASRSHYARLLRAGVRIYEFEGGLLHAKTLTVDGAITFMGSSNMDIRSFDLNFENDVLFRDAALTAAVRERQAQYLSRSREVTLAEVEAWPLWRRIVNNSVATVSPML